MEQPRVRRAKQQKPLSKKAQKQNGFVLDCTNMASQKLSDYNSVKDKHLKNYFIYFKHHGSSVSKSKTQRVKLPALKQQINHQNFLQFLQTKTSQTKRKLNQIQTIQQ